MGFQTGDAYSKTGLTAVAYVFALICLEQFLKFRLRTPSERLALLAVSEMCLVHDKSSLTVTPGYLLLSTTSSVCP